jgi:hypothetical protein
MTSWSLLLHDVATRGNTFSWEYWTQETPNTVMFLFQTFQKMVYNTCDYWAYSVL